MRILILSPWFRTLAVAWAHALRAQGHAVSVVASSQHFDPPPLGPDDVELGPRWRTRQGVSEFREAHRHIRRWRPDVALIEPARDPRYALLLPRGVPFVVTTHDHRPHDRANRTEFMRRLNTAHLLSRARREVVFSHYVASRLGDRGHPVDVVPLTSELAETDTPAFVPADRRHDFLLLGRLSEYKNVALVMEAYERHRHGPGFRGDRLVLMGDGDPGTAVPTDVMWLDARYSFGDAAERLAHAKMSLAVYRAGSQSGVQVMGAQCGTYTAVTDVGGLREYQPEGMTPVEPTVRALSNEFDRLADPAVAATLGRVAREHYLKTCSADRSAEALAVSLLRARAGGTQP